jgi:hypothetical protein
MPHIPLNSVIPTKGLDSAYILYNNRTPRAESYRPADAASFHFHTECLKYICVCVYIYICIFCFIRVRVSQCFSLNFEEQEKKIE